MADDLLTLETRGWQALSSDLQHARQFYGELLSETAVMVFPGGLVLRGREQVLASFGAQPWADYRLDEAATLPVGDSAAILSYRVTARREGSADYKAWVSSTYSRRHDRWYLCFHQHTMI